MIQGRHSTHIWLLNWVGWNNVTSTPHAWKHVFGKFWERLLVYLQLCWCQTDKPAKRLGCNLFGVSGPCFNVCLYLCVCVCVCGSHTCSKWCSDQLCVRVCVFCFCLRVIPWDCVRAWQDRSIESLKWVSLILVHSLSETNCFLRKGFGFIKISENIHRWKYLWNTHRYTRNIPLAS